MTIAACYGALQHVAAGCSVLQRVAVCLGYLSSVFRALLILSSEGVFCDLLVFVGLFVFR